MLRPFVPARRWARVLSAAVVLPVVLAGLVLAPASAQAGITSTAFSGTNGVVTSNGSLYARQGALLTLTVTTSSDTQCVDVSGAFTDHAQSSTGKTLWTFTTTAPVGDGVKAVTVAVTSNFNANKCTGNAVSGQASYVLDNTGPVVTGSLSPAANANLWNNHDTVQSWTAIDAGSGVATGPNPAGSNENQEGVFTRTSTATDRLGNVGNGSFTVRIDKTAPTIAGASVDNSNGTTTVTFTCNDALSGITSCLADGSSTNSKTVTGPTTVSGTATDQAGNTRTANVNVPAPDKTAPTIVHATSPLPNAVGWTRADTTVTFSCKDLGSGIDSCVADGTSPASPSRTITGETAGTLVGGTATDKAGNIAHDSATVKIDRTPPTVEAARDRAPNAAGWYDANVVVSYTCADTLSGVKTCPAAQILTEGAGQSASGTATDNAGNAASDSVTGVDIDKTPPALSGAYTAGWHTGDVTVNWTCTDALSGPSAQPADSIVTGEGANLSATATCTDKAGNSTTRTVTGIQIDRHAPTTAVSGPANDWVSGDVTVNLSATDPLSGVGYTVYAVDGGSFTSGTTVTLSTEGDHAVSFYSVDTAGNVETTQNVHVRIDKTAPTIGHVFTPGSYADGAWINQDVTVTFQCGDQGGSGLATCEGDTTVTTEGLSQEVDGSATDGAGNQATDSALVSIDKTKPVIKGSVDRGPNELGWYDADVVVSFKCSDSLAGIDTCAPDKTLHEGQGQSTAGTATDNAGNSATDTVSGIDVDETAPELSASYSTAWSTGDVTVHWSCHDALSGVVGPDHSIVGPDRHFTDVVQGEGEDLSSTATCEDAAGNQTTETVHDIRIDRTAPSTAISVTGTISPSGWYRAGIEVTLEGTDNLSDVDMTYFSLDGGAAQAYTGKVPVTHDGIHHLGYWSVDVAGNVEDGHTVTLKVDQTPPTLAGHATTDPNGNGWYREDVTVTWTCSDDTSGIVPGACPADSTVGGEGPDLSATESVSDVARNSTSTTVGGISIDRTAPVTTGSIPALPASGWFTQGVQVTLSAGDNLSGVESTTYAVDGGAAQPYSGPFTVHGDGPHEVEFFSADNAGNVETAGSPLTFQIDGTAPTTKATNPISPASEWFVTSGIPFAFDATDNAEGSGVAATYYTIDGGLPQTYGQPFTKNLSDGPHQVTYWSVDTAGNEEPHHAFPINVDTVPPTITGHQTPAANAFGWNNTDVAVTFTCTDDTSGIQGVAGCAGDTPLVNETAGQTVHGDAVDVAGNTSATAVGPVRIDKTAPTLTGVPGHANGAGWYNGDVSVKWVGDDSLSGIDPATQPAPSIVPGEGRHLGADASISDKAGNVGHGSVTDLKIDRGAPTVTGHPTASPNADGWFHGDVVVDWVCTDPKLSDGTDGSGVASCPTSSLIKGNGANQSATSGQPSDVAGNVGSAATVGGIDIDGTAPASSANNQCTAANDWCTGSTADIVLAATDDLSGVKAIHYRVDGSSEHVALGATTTVTVPLTGTGAASVSYWAVDVAGNVETANAVSLKWDNIAPTVTHSLSPAPNAQDWNNADVTVTFSAKDDDHGSGVTSVTPPVTISVETAGQLVTGTAKDTAGNVGTDSVTVKLDKTKPTVTAGITSGTLGSNGWYVGPVTVTFTCSDALSGIATCPDPMVLSANGPGQSASGTATDKAGNTASTTVAGIKIDQEPPTLTTAGVNVAGGTYPLGTSPKATCTASDSFSGLASCIVTVTGGTSVGVGTFSWTATARDNAGNTSVLRGTYQVTYRFDGFLQPINDTAHQIGASTSVFKAGSTVPVKLQLKDSAGNLVIPVTAPEWLTPVKGSSMSVPVDESVYSLSGDSGTAYKNDGGGQWSYNWKTGSTAGSYWRVGVRLDDGQTYYVNLGLR
jgi:hypothetical protein